MGFGSKPRQRVLCISPAHPLNDPRVLKTIGTLANHYDVQSLLPWRVDSSLGVLPFYPQLALRLVLVHPLIVWALIQRRPHILHLFMPELLPIALLFRLFGGQVVYEVQENHRLKFDRKPRNKHPIFTKIFNYLDRLARRYCYCVFTEGSYLTEYHDLRLPWAVVHNFPDMSGGRARSRFGYDVSSTTFFDLCYLGLISLDRGLDTMVAVLDRLPNCRLHLFGRIADDCLGLLIPQRDRVVIHGHVDQDDAFPIMTKCIAGLALLKPVGDYPGSYPTKLFEYMALGLPVITSDFPLYRSVIETHQCGFCVDPTDVIAIVERIKWLSEHPLEAQRMGGKGKIGVVDLYSWRSEANILLELYQNIGF